MEVQLKPEIGTPRLEENQISQSERGNRSSFVWRLIWLRKTKGFQVKVWVLLVFVVTHGGILAEFFPEWAGSCLACFEKNEWWHSRHCTCSTLGYLEKVYGTCYCSRYTTNDLQNLYRHLPELQTVALDNIWKMVYLISSIFLTLQIRTRHSDKNSWHTSNFIDR